MVLEFSHILMESYTKGIGFKTNNMGSEQSFGLINQLTVVTTGMGKKKAREDSIGLMAQDTLASSKIIRFKAKEPIFGLICGIIQALGLITRCMVKESSFGLMVVVTMANTIKILSKGKEFLHGRISVAMKVNG